MWQGAGRQLDCHVTLISSRLPCYASPLEGMGAYILSLMPDCYSFKPLEFTGEEDGVPGADNGTDDCFCIVPNTD